MIRSPSFVSWAITFVEAVALTGIGLYINSQPKLTDLAQIWFAVSAIIILNRIVTAFDNRQIFYDERQNIDAIDKRIERIETALNLSRNSDLKKIDELLQAHLALEEPRLYPERDRIVSEAIQSIMNVVKTGRTPILEEPDFYDWLFREFENSTPGTEILIVSMDEDLEWTDTPQEKRFFQANADAAKRGVYIERIFCFSEGRLAEARRNQAIYAHRTGNTYGLKGSYVNEGDFRSRAPTAFAEAGQGFILINNRHAIVDVFSQDGEARGYVTFDKREVEHYRITFDRFKNLSMPLEF